MAENKAPAFSHDFGVLQLFAFSVADEFITL